jgi:spermidine dehydrogenase
MDASSESGGKFAMKPRITRRDFLNGIAVGAGTSLLAPVDLLAQVGPVAAASGESSAYYPPTLTGMRGSHDGSFEVAHALVMEGQKPGEYERLDEPYDLVVVGAGISGLAAAYLYREQAGVDAKILILDNHDDFGGHAIRNEFRSGGKMLLGFGGSVNLEQDAIGASARALLEEIGVEFKVLQEAGAPDYALSNAEAPYGIYLGRETYGEDQIVAGAWPQAWAGAGDYRKLIGSLNLSEDDKQKLVSLVSGEDDYLAGVPLPEKERYLRSTSYGKFLSDRVGLSRPASKLHEPWLRAIFGVGAESLSVMEAVMLGAPGLNVLGLPDESAQAESSGDAPTYRYPVFPDGNASVARLFVRKLIPEVAPGDTMQDLVTAPFDYSGLDRETSPVRIRLNSTAVNARQRGEDAVEVSYVTGGRAFKVRGKHCILACYNGMIPHLCPELPQAQKEGLAYGVKVPFIWANVLLRSGEAVRRGGASVYMCPDNFFELVSHAPPVTLGNYHASSRPKDPMVMFMGHVPVPEANRSQSARDLYRLGRTRLLATSFATYETEIRKQLTGMFGGHGFDADRDIQAITVNRWSHGYAYEYLDLHDPDWAEGQAPHELARAQFGRISTANSDSEAYAYVQAAIDAAARAVGEQLAAV